MATMNETATTVYHILAGSFRSVSLFLLAFSPIHRSVYLVQKVDGFGPHQYIAINPDKDRVYTTSWAQPPILSSWEVQKPEDGPWRVHHVNNVPITATSSYITIPRPYTHAYSVGGPTGEAHLLDPFSGAFGSKVQQMLFVPEGELELADKTRVALRYGSHAIEFSSTTDHAFIPILGTNKIEMYTRDRLMGKLTHIVSVPSPRGPDAHDGPRHLKVHPNGKILYSVTEHSNWVDIYAITSTSLTHLSSHSLIPNDSRSLSHVFRGDTLLLAPSTSANPYPVILFATTRGSIPAYRGYLSAFALDADGMVVDQPPPYYYETSTSGGKANAIDLLPKSIDEGPDQTLWILLTDDDDAVAEHGNGVRVLEWIGWGEGKGVKEVAGWPDVGEKGYEAGSWMMGGSHAVWLD